MGLRSFGVLVLADEEVNAILEKIKEVYQKVYHSGRCGGYFIEISKDGFEIVPLSEEEFGRFPRKKKGKKVMPFLLRKAV